ncbi:MAG TPA: chloride channel protein, partial [Gemmatimonadaceae bacterium]|nr:chloride channel protein [Gemmatimonadaceae bacterium]
MADELPPALNAASGLPVAPALAPALASVEPPPEYSPVDQRVVVISGIAVLVGIGAALLANLLTRLIGLITNVAYYGRISTSFTAPSTVRLGAWSIFVPIVGALVVGIMARYGAAAIRGHGIPEVMERVLYAKSRIAPRIMFLKPLSAAVAIGTGGPFGAEGPIIATGGALGSIVGQYVRVTADERKTLLAAGAAAGMAATFGSPVSAVLLAVELLLFEYRPRSIIPVALASAVAAGVRAVFLGSAPVFTVPALAQPNLEALSAYTLIGALVGIASVGVTRFVYWIEDLYEELPIHWMWWPLVGAIFVGVIGYFEPRTLGVGYTNIDSILSGNIVGRALIVLVVLKFISWSIYLGSGTSGGTLAPLFTIGGGIGAALGSLGIILVPSLGIDANVSALVGMAAIFAGASHALLTSVVFAFETTRQPLGLLPLLAGCSAAYLVSLLMMRSSIMTEKLARRGARVRTEYAADYLSQILVRDGSSREVVSLRGSDLLREVRAWLTSGGSSSSHQGFPVLDDKGELCGVLTRRDLLDNSHDDAQTIGSLVKRGAVVVFDDNTLREAADHMVRAGVGRLPVVSRDAPRAVIGIVSRSDLLSAQRAVIGIVSRSDLLSA